MPYRETIKAVVKDAEYKHKKQTGGHGQYGHVHLRLEPLKRGQGFEFLDEIVGGVVPGKFIPAVEKGVVEAMKEGVLAGYPVVDVRVALHYGSYHDVDSSEMAFKIAGSQAFKKGFLEAKPILLEPIYNIEVKVPEDAMGDVMGDISSRRGKISGMEAVGHYQIIRAQVPAAELHKYATILRSKTGGRGVFSASHVALRRSPARAGREDHRRVGEEQEQRAGSLSAHPAATAVCKGCGSGWIGPLPFFSA